MKPASSGMWGCAVLVKCARMQQDPLKCCHTSTRLHNTPSLKINFIVTPAKYSNPTSYRVIILSDKCHLSLLTVQIGVKPSGLCYYGKQAKRKWQPIVVK